MTDHMEGLDVAAWELWLQYRRNIKKPIREPSFIAAQKRFLKLGEYQMCAVNHSIAHGWQGLWLPRKERDTLDRMDPEANW